MTQHHRKKEGSCKHRRKFVWEKGLEYLGKMDLPRPLTKRTRRIAFCEARKKVKHDIKFGLL